MGKNVSVRGDDGKFVKFDVIAHDAMVANLEQVYKLATTEEIFDGLAWYTLALAQCNELARKYSIALQKVIGIVAACSPQTPWSRNIKLAEGMIVAFQTGRPLSGHTADVKGKVRAILTCDTNDRSTIATIVWGKPQKAFKTVNFYYDIDGRFEYDGLHPAICGGTIDRWAFSAALMTYVGPDNMPGLDAERYVAVQQAYAAVAERHHMEVRQLQAIVWVVWRRLNGIVD